MLGVYPDDLRSFRRSARISSACGGHPDAQQPFRRLAFTSTLSPTLGTQPEVRRQSWPSVPISSYHISWRFASVPSHYTSRASRLPKPITHPGASRPSHPIVYPSVCVHPIPIASRRSASTSSRHVYDMCINATIITSSIRRSLRQVLVITSPIRRSLRRWYPITRPSLSASVVSHYPLDAICVSGIPLPTRRYPCRWHLITHSALSAPVASHYLSGTLCVGGIAFTVPYPSDALCVGGIIIIISIRRFLC
jgi:hypothetical protein